MSEVAVIDFVAKSDPLFPFSALKVGCATTCGWSSWPVENIDCPEKRVAMYQSISDGQREKVQICIEPPNSRVHCTDFVL